MRIDELQIFSSEMMKKAADMIARREDFVKKNDIEMKRNASEVYDSMVNDHEIEK